VGNCSQGTQTTNALAKPILICTGSAVINEGLLDAARYMPHVIAGWEGMVRDALHADGFLGWVQSTGKDPAVGQPLSYDKPPDFEDHGLGAVLLDGSEV
jgi:hypothetical protein